MKDDAFDHDDLEVAPQPEAVQPELEVIEADETMERLGPTYRMTREPAEALVIHCGDPRFQEAFRQFITRELGFRNYIPIIIGGGIHAFGMQTFMPKNFKILWEQVKFFIKEGRVNQVIIINHEDCAWYKKMKGYHPTVSLPVKGRFDLRTAARLILRDFAGVSVHSYWAALDGDVITFSEVSEGRGKLS